MRYRSWIIMAVLVCAVIVLALVSYKRASLQLPPKIRIAAGPIKGYYYKLGSEIKKIIENKHPKVTVEVLQTQGSEENLRLVAERRVDFGFYQNSGQTSASIRTIANLYSEALHIIAKSTARITSINDLKGKVVSIGPEGSGTRLMALEVLEHYNIQLKDFDVRSAEFDELEAAFAAGDVQAAFVVMGVLAPGLINLLRQHDDLELVPVEYAEALTMKKPSMCGYHLPKGAYRASPPVPADGFVTVAVKASVITAKYTSAFLVKYLTELVFSDAFRKGMNLTELNGTFAQEEEDFKIHKGALAYYNRQKPTPYHVMLEGLKQASGFLIALIILATGIPLFLLRISRTKKKFLRERFCDYARKLQEQMSEVLVEDDVRTLTRHTQMLQTLRERIVTDVLAGELGQEESMILLQLSTSLFTMSHFRLLLSENIRRENGT